MTEVQCNKFLAYAVLALVVFCVIYSTAVYLTTTLSKRLTTRQRPPAKVIDSHLQFGRTISSDQPAHQPTRNVQLVFTVLRRYFTRVFLLPTNVMMGRSRDATRHRSGGSKEFVCHSPECWAVVGIVFPSFSKEYGGVSGIRFASRANVSTTEQPKAKDKDPDENIKACPADDLEWKDEEAEVEMGERA